MFIPLLFMEGVVGRLFREFAIVLSVSVLVSMVISLTLTPMMCGYLLRPAAEERPGIVNRTFEAAFEALRRGFMRPPASVGGAAAGGVDAGHGGTDAGRHRVAVHRHAKGLPAAAGYRDHRHYPRSAAGRFVPAHVGPATRRR